MIELPKEIQATIEASEIPDLYKPLVIELLSKFGFEWIIELYESPEPEEKSSLSEERGSLSVGIGNWDDIYDLMIDETKKKIKELTEKMNEINGTQKPDLYEAVIEFVEAIEFMDWDDDLRVELDYKKDILQTWWDLKVDYLRSVKNLKINLARDEASKEVESVDIGLEEVPCRKCGVHFYDNLSKHFGNKALYCSVSCRPS